MPTDQSDAGLRIIVERISSVDENPVTRARRIVELQVPPSRRGPGWDRHWRKLEAYLETPGNWSDEHGALGSGSKTEGAA
jgi:hypothetical protein